MFGSHPKLKQVEAYDGPTQAFVAGYMTHLVGRRDVDYQHVPALLRQ